MKELIETFGKVLKKLRHEANMSQEVLSEKSNLDRTYISLLERGLRQPSLTTLFSLASALDVRATKLIALTEEKCESP